MKFLKAGFMKRVSYPTTNTYKKHVNFTSQAPLKNLHQYVCYASLFRYRLLACAYFYCTIIFLLTTLLFSPVTFTR